MYDMVSIIWVSLIAQMVKNPSANALDLGSIPWSIIQKALCFTSSIILSSSVSLQHHFPVEMTNIRDLDGSWRLTDLH